MTVDDTDILELGKSPFSIKMFFFLFLTNLCVLGCEILHFEALWPLWKIGLTVCYLVFFFDIMQAFILIPASKIMSFSPVFLVSLAQALTYTTINCTTLELCFGIILYLEEKQNEK